MTQPTGAAGPVPAQASIYKRTLTRTKSINLCRCGGIAVYELHLYFRSAGKSGMRNLGRCEIHGRASAIRLNLELP